MWNHYRQALLSACYPSRDIGHQQQLSIFLCPQKGSANNRTQPNPTQPKTLSMMMLATSCQLPSLSSRCVQCTLSIIEQSWVGCAWNGLMNISLMFFSVFFLMSRSETDKSLKNDKDFVRTGNRTRDPVSNTQCSIRSVTRSLTPSALSAQWHGVYTPSALSARWHGV